MPYYMGKWVQKWKPNDPKHWILVLPLSPNICRVVSLEPLGYFVQIKGLETYSLSPIQT